MRRRGVAIRLDRLLWKKKQLHEEEKRGKKKNLDLAPREIGSLWGGSLFCDRNRSWRRKKKMEKPKEHEGGRPKRNVATGAPSLYN